MSTSAHDLLHDILDVCNETDRCTCVSLAHVTDTPGYDEAMGDVLTALSAIVDSMTPLRNEEDLQLLATAVRHLLNIVLALGYAIGASDAYDVTLSSDIVVPDSLAALDFLEPGPEAS